VVCAVLLLAWVASGFGFVALYLSHDVMVLIHGGSLRIDVGLGMDPALFPRYARFRGGAFYLDWTAGWDSRPPLQFYWISLWIPLAASLATCGTAWRLDTLARRRAKLGACPKCSYSRAGLAPSAVCPECGTAAPTGSFLT
jgi:hypothetical protein